MLIQVNVPQPQTPGLNNSVRGASSVSLSVNTFEFISAIISVMQCV